MSRISALIYDCEIVNGPPPRDDNERREGVTYCEGWGDKEGMGISVIGAYDYEEDRYRVFCEDNRSEFRDLVERRSIIVGFNNIAFDNKLCAAHDVLVPDEKSYDLLREIRAATKGERPRIEHKRTGLSLGDVAAANGGTPKAMGGELAPVEWQCGRYGSVIDYCLHDVLLTKLLFDLVISSGRIADPRYPGEFLTIRPPAEMCPPESPKAKEPHKSAADKLADL